jgi:hypothetical protein
MKKHTEASLVRALKALEKRWPDGGYWLQAGGGINTLALVKGPRGLEATELQDATVESFNIPSDGGDPY